MVWASHYETIIIFCILGLKKYVYYRLWAKLLKIREKVTIKEYRKVRVNLYCIGIRGTLGFIPCITIHRYRKNLRCVCVYGCDTIYTQCQVLSTVRPKCIDILIAVNTSSNQILITKYHSLIKRNRALW